MSLLVEPVAAPSAGLATLWAATDLHAIERPDWDVGPRRCDLVQVDAVDRRERTYRMVDQSYLGWLATAYRRAEAAGRITPTIQARWLSILAWCAQRHGERWVNRAVDHSAFPDYPAPGVCDRWCDRIVDWRRRHSEPST